MISNYGAQTPSISQAIMKPVPQEQQRNPADGYWLGPDMTPPAANQRSMLPGANSAGYQLPSTVVTPQLPAPGANSAGYQIGVPAGPAVPQYPQLDPRGLPLQQALTGTGDAVSTSPQQPASPLPLLDPQSLPLQQATVGRAELPLQKATVSNSKSIDYGVPVERETMPTLRSTFGDRRPAQYVTNGGTSQLIGGYGADSLLAQDIRARMNGQTVDQLIQTDARAKVMGLRSSPEYQALYQKTLTATGSPSMALAQTDAAYAQQMPEYATAFINSGNDEATQKRFDDAVIRQNNAAVINPRAGAASYTSGLPLFGITAVGVDQDGKQLVTTPSGMTAAFEPKTLPPADLNRFLIGPTGQATAAKDPNQLTAFEKLRVGNWDTQNRRAQIDSYSKMIGAASTRYQKAFEMNDIEGMKQAKLDMDMYRKELNNAAGFTPEARPTVVNGGGNGS